MLRQIMSLVLLTALILGCGENKVSNAKKSSTPSDNVVSTESHFPEYSQNEKDAVAAVFQDVGPLYINEPQENAEASEVKISGPMPWAGYWYPKRRPELFSGENSPLSKLDRAAAAQGLTIQSAQWEQKLYSSDDAEWAGLCDAWAFASVYEKEPQKAVSMSNIEFSISDQKALLTKKYEGLPVKTYGRRYFGNYETDGEIQDLRPEAFHRLVEAYIGEHDQAIIIDDDPGPEVWNKPLYRMRWTVAQDPQNSDAVIVTAWPFLIKSRNQISDEVTKPQDMKAPEYQYRLFVDRNQKKDGKMLVVAGEWIGPSLTEHADMVFIPQQLSSGDIKPLNPEIGKALNLIDSIASKGN